MKRFLKIFAVTCVVATVVLAALLVFYLWPALIFWLSLLLLSIVTAMALLGEFDE